MRKGEDKNKENWHTKWTKIKAYMKGKKIKPEHD